MHLPPPTPMPLPIVSSGTTSPRPMGMSHKRRVARVEEGKEQAHPPAYESRVVKAARRLAVLRVYCSLGEEIDES